jgi:hypothetical protein
VYKQLPSTKCGVAGVRSVALPGGLDLTRYKYVLLRFARISSIFGLLVVFIWERK